MSHIPTGDVEAVRCHYWDASALVKVVADDPDEAPGRVAVRELFHNHPLHYSTSYCVAEALSALKLKWLRDRVAQAEYFKAVRDFFRLVVSHLSIDDIPITPQALQQAESFMADHHLDFIDAIQVLTLLHGRFAVFTGDSQSLLVTADRRLAAAAQHARARVWLCLPGPNGC